MRTLALCLLLVLQHLAFGNRTSFDDILELEDGAKCPKGTWSGSGLNEKDFGECEQCLEGQYCDKEGSDIDCDVCEAGTYAPDLGYWECLKCPAGKINTESNSVECYDCPKGKHSPNEGGQECVDCLPGHYQDEEGAAGCKVCRAGEYQDSAGSADCKLCPAGKSSPEQSVAADSCVDCPAGSYSSTAGSMCLPCPVLTYQDVSGATSCKDCPANTDKKGATECKVSCPEGQVPAEGICKSCDPGSFAPIGANSCTKCPKGQYSSIAGAGHCDQCPEKTYGPEIGMKECLECDGNNEKGMADCRVVCPAGEIVKDGKCEACPAGQYESQGQCFVCAAGTFSDKAGSVTCDVCGLGHFSAEGAVKCEVCLEGHYQDKTGQGYCEKCPEGYYGPVTGAADCLKCYQGFFNPKKGQSSCQECPPGTFTDLDGQPSCMDCDAGTYSISSSKCELCPAGHFSDDKAAVCTACARGFYASNQGSSACIPARAGYYVDMEGAVAPTPCPLGTYNELTGMSSCTPCPEGKGTSQEGATSINQCKDINCLPGYYRDPDLGCKICPKGTFSNIENAVACRSCPRHQYNSEEGSVQCMKCPVTAFTWSDGTDSLEGCIGPVIEVCTEEDMSGNCYRYYDDNMNVNTTIKSVQVISGEFELFDLTNMQGYHTKLSERHGSHNVAELGRLSNLRSFSAILNDVFCSLDQGWKYHGTIRKTSKSGKACINWKRTPLAHKAAPNHYCQNPDGNRLGAKPYCYISETETEECDIPSCVWDMDCFTGNGVHYRGKKSGTVSGYDCQNWNRDYPVIHSYHSPEYNWAGVGEHTHCRNPSPESEDKPWCFKDYFWSWFEIWDYCDIPRCSRDQFEFYRF